jgi:hypothetical protein
VDVGKSRSITVASTLASAATTVLVASFLYVCAAAVIDAPPIQSPHEAEAIKTSIGGDSIPSGEPGYGPSSPARNREVDQRNTSNLATLGIATANSATEAETKLLSGLGAPVLNSLGNAPASAANTAPIPLGPSGAATGVREEGNGSSKEIGAAPISSESRTAATSPLPVAGAPQATFSLKKTASFPNEGAPSANRIQSATTANALQTAGDLARLKKSDTVNLGGAGKSGQRAEVSSVERDSSEVSKAGIALNNSEDRGDDAVKKDSRSATSASSVAASANEPRSVPRPILRRHCVAILKSPKEYDDDVVSLCRAWVGGEVRGKGVGPGSPTGSASGDIGSTGSDAAVFEGTEGENPGSPFKRRCTFILQHSEYSRELVQLCALAHRR